MGLKDLLNIGEETNPNKKVEIDKSKVREHLADYQNIIDYWRKYPDKFIDYLCSLNPDNSFRLYYIQRVYLRVVMRYRTVYAVFSRGFSKSFLAVMCLMIKATLYPGAKLATVADGKGQSAAILSSKLREICQLIPAFANEIIWDTRGKIAQTTQSKDQVTYAFRNGSQISNAAMTETTRGQRFQSILVEESAKVDQEKLTEIIMPTLVISRQINGKTDPNEVLNQSAIFVTSAGYKGTYAYEKLIDTLCHSVAGKSNEAFILGGDWKIPVVEGLQPANFIQSQENDSSMDEAGFDREYNSIWAGTVEGAFFNPSKFDQHRVLQLAQNQFDKGTSKDGYYCMGVDVGRFGDMTEVVVIKVTPAKTGVSLKQVVNIYTFEEDHFEKQAIQLKRLFLRFKCDMCVVDGNGVGAGLIDYLVRDQIDPETGDLLPNWGVYNDDDKRYKQWETEDTIHNAMYIMKANQPINSELFAYCQAQLNSGKLKFLIDESVAKNKLMTQSQGKKMTTLQRADYLRPFVETSILKSQMMNLVQQNEGANIILKQATRKVKKDKFSALIYGLSWPKLQEEKAHKRKGRNIKDFLMFTKHG